MKERSVALIGCSAKKLSRAAPAQELYCGTRFRLALEYTKDIAYRYVLSALHGLVPLEQVLAPYEKSIETMDFGERDGWAKGVVLDLQQHIRKGRLIRVIAEDCYTAPLRPYLPPTTEYPLRGLDEDAQKKFLALGTSTLIPL